MKEQKKMARNLMIQGTSSGAGKSLIAAGLCRIFADAGYKTAPFKAQNMALNSYITDDGKEVGRAQAVQAEAARVPLDVRMNPVLLKPTSHSLTQVIVHGKVYANIPAGAFHQLKKEIRPETQKAYTSLAHEYEVIIIEGAGSPAEINLQEDDFANMGTALFTKSPVLLVADIDRGGAFAAIYGTVMLLNEEERRHIKGIIINKFRGKKELLQSGIDKIEDLTGIPVLGVIPYETMAIEDEDSLTEKFSVHQDEINTLRIEIPRLPHISNFTDFDIFAAFPEVSLRYVQEGEHFQNPDLIILPGTKNTMEDLLFLRKTGLEKQILQAHKNGTPLVGICGGYQMLGSKIIDPNHLETSLEEVAGMGLLSLETVFESGKITQQTSARINAHENPGTFLDGTEGMILQGYQIHCGRTHSQERAFSSILSEKGSLSKMTEEDAISNGNISCQENSFSENNAAEGSVSHDGSVFGTYFHGIFDNMDFTRQLLNNLRKKRGLSGKDFDFSSYQEFKELQYDKLANLLRENLDIEKIKQIVFRNWSIR